MKRWLTLAATTAVVAALAPAAPAAAEESSSSTRLMSGLLQPDGSDLHTQVSTDGGASFSPSRVVDPLPEWDGLDFGRWISTDDSYGVSRGTADTVFRREWWIPAGLVRSSTTLCVLADGGVQARLNGTVLVDQSGVDAGNALLPADCAGPVDLLRSGPNVLEFTVRNDEGPVGLQYSADVSWTVDDDAPPMLVLPGDLTVPADGPDGARVRYEAVAVDSTSGAWPTPVCDPPSGALFPVGTTTVTCQAEGHAGLVSSGSFAVTVLPWATNAAPELTLPSDVVVDTKSMQGTRVSWVATATDDSGTPTVTCTPASGSFFAIGTTTVSCTAQDAGGLTDTGSFPVTVRGPVQRACEHLAAVPPTWSTYWLQWRLRSAGTEVADAGRAADARALRKMADRVRAAGGEFVRPPLHRAAVALADEVADRLGCP